MSGPSAVEILYGIAAVLLGYGVGVIQFAEKKKYNRMGDAICAVALVLVLVGVFLHGN